MLRNTTLYISQKLTPSLSLFLFILNILSNPVNATNTTNTTNTSNASNASNTSNATNTTNASHTTNATTAPNDDIKLAEIFGPYAGLILMIVVALIIARIKIGHGLGPAKRAASSKSSNHSEDNPKDTTSSIVNHPNDEKPDTASSSTVVSIPNEESSTASFSSHGENDAAEEVSNYSP